MLAKIAQKHLKKCTYGHSDRTERTKAAAPYFTSVGENLAATTGKITDYPSFIKKTWGAEELLYSYPNCNSGKVCGHYTQVRCEIYMSCSMMLMIAYTLRVDGLGLYNPRWMCCCQLSLYGFPFQHIRVQLWTSVSGAFIILHCLSISILIWKAVIMKPFMF